MKSSNLFIVCLLIAGLWLWISSAIKIFAQPVRTEWAGNRPTSSTVSATRWAQPSAQPVHTYHSHSYRTRTCAAYKVQTMPTLAMQSTGGAIRPLATTSSAQAVNIGGGGGSQAGGGGSSSGSKGITYASGVAAMPSIQMVSTSASLARGTTTDHSRLLALPSHRGTPGSGGIPDCPGCVDANGDGICDRCDCDLLDGCTCESESGYCWCPIDGGWEVMAFMALLAALYYRRAAAQRRT